MTHGLFLAQTAAACLEAIGFRARTLPTQAVRDLVDDVLRPDPGARSDANLPKVFVAIEPLFLELLRGLHRWHESLHHRARRPGGPDNRH